MKKSEWSDRELEELLRLMPKIQDHRDPRDIYQNVSLKKRKTKSWMLPGIAAAAALFLFFILAPKLMDSTNYSHDKTQEQKSSGNQKMKIADKRDTSMIALQKDDPAVAKENSPKTVDKPELMSTNSTKTAIYDEEVGDGTVLTYWIPDPDVQILIPVSIIVPAAEDTSRLTLFNENMANLKEKEWGLSDFYPLDLTRELYEENNSINVDVPENHQYGLGSMEPIFINALINDISSNSISNKIILTTNGQPGIDFERFGKQENLDIVNKKNHAFFFYYPKGSDYPFLTPSEDSYKDINTAFNAMQTDKPVLGLKSSLLPLQPLNDVTVIDRTLYVSFKGHSDLKDNQLTSSSFEALLLTAKEFGLEKVIVKDSPITHIGSFDLSKENKVPVAPNLRTIQ
ncbi:Anti-sigma-X factor RsiX [Neobacillus rhizosphaerae]|uniref:Anti-sigma-X factor RsiX n=1 Tax=Neobacillus rhizosphaerae TaxID=2880965 RepID=A0ABM9ESR7_9BACI|nr:hypothetical protein [Neobacillus rhizosphaerae]CAH2715699.1 Anti-sigma-X factor RsiX [Neobacillus rhizosphaerae]